MWPWGHVAVGYLCYVGYTQFGAQAERAGLTVLAVGFGTQLPDLVDKPLAWTVGVLPSGRSLAHSLLVATVVVALVRWIARRRDYRGVSAAFGIGYLSHLFSDLGPAVLFGLLRGDLSQLQWTTYLLWPILSPPPYPHDESFLQHFLAFDFSPYVWFQFGLFALAVAVWVADGAPGVAETRALVRRWVSTNRA